MHFFDDFYNMNSHTDENSIQKCLQLIEEKLQWGNASDWHNEVFIELSEKIHEETSVLLSPTTLKRVWGKVNYKSAPSITTLNTLALFAGFANWRDFKNSYQSKPTSWFERKVSSNFNVIVPAAIILALGFVSIYSMIDPSNTKEGYDFSRVTFSSEPITSGLPNSVIFNLNLDTIDSDSIYIQQFWDVTKTVKLKPKQEQATGIYYYPGHFNASLLVDGKTIRQHDLFIKSEGWLGTIDYSPIPKYIEEKALNNQGMLFSDAIIDEIRNNEQPIQSSFHYVKDFNNVSGDNIGISSTIKSVLNNKWAVCQTTRIVILGTEGALIIPFSKLGCVSDIGLMLNDTFYSGKEHDLSAFGIDFNDYRKIDIKIKDKQVLVFIDDNQVYRGDYNKSIGQLAGIRYRFLGAGHIKHFEFTDVLNDVVFLKNDFVKY